MTSAILVTGGTGTLGRRLVPLLREAGHELRVLSRHDHPPEEGIEYVNCDLIKGVGVESAVQGMETVVHLAGGAKGDDKAAQNLVPASVRADVKHFVFISVIGADKVPIAWLRSQLAVEQIIAESGVPWTTLRAAQFHELVFDVVQKLAKMPVVPIPGGLRFQPVDSRDVAERLAELTFNKPAGLVKPLAGPQAFGVRELVGGYLDARGKHRLFVPMRIPGKAGKAYRAGDNLALGGNDVGKRTWEEFLAEQVR